MKSKLLFVLCSLTFLLIGCSQKQTAETYPDGRRKLVREYAWPGAKDSQHLRTELTYAPDGTLESEAHFRHGMLDGKFITYWPNGKIKVKGFYQHDEAEGEWNYFFNAYTLEAQGRFHNGLREGPWIEYWENGELHQRGFFIAGKQTGEWVEWISTGGEVLRTSCFESNATGHYKSSYDNGSLKEEYDCRFGKPSGPYIRNNADSSVLTRGFYDTAGAQDSLWTRFHSNGRPAMRQRFQHGLRDDSLMAWDSLGRVTERGFFRLGTGEMKRYDSLNHIVEIKTFKNGNPLSFKRWHPNHVHWIEGSFVDGKKSGVWKTWDDRGTLRESAQYLNGEFNGDRRFFDTTGALTRLQQYDRGMPTRGLFPKISGAH